jgi:hypothetical protein
VAHHAQVNFNAQLLIEDPGTGVSGPNTYADAAQCLANSRLSAATFHYTAQSSGMAGYEEYMSWVKQQVIAGHQVTIAILLNGGSDPQYDHEVSVIKIGTNHLPTDPTYYPDDVVYFDDHGVYTLSGDSFTSNPRIPPGAGADSTGCTPYVFGYTFGSLAKTRAGANRHDAQAYSIVIPGERAILVYTGGSGYDPVPIVGPHNYAFSVAGPEDPKGETLPVALTIVGPTVIDESARSHRRIRLRKPDDWDQQPGPELHQQAARCVDDELRAAGDGKRPYARGFLQFVRVRFFVDHGRGSRRSPGGSRAGFQRQRRNGVACYDVQGGRFHLHAECDDYVGPNCRVSVRAGQRAVM